MKDTLGRFTWKRALVALLSLIAAFVITWGLFIGISMIMPIVKSSLATMEEQIPIPAYVVPEYSR